MDMIELEYSLTSMALHSCFADNACSVIHNQWYWHRCHENASSAVASNIMAMLFALKIVNVTTSISFMRVMTIIGALINQCQLI